MKRCGNIVWGITLSVLHVVALPSFGQNEKIEIKFLGNCGLFMTDGRMNLYVDFPYKSGAFSYMSYKPELLDSIPPNSVFLFTHGHADHFSKKLFKKTKQKLLATKSIKFSISKKRKYSFSEINDSLPNFSITTIKTDHHLSFKHHSYIIEWNDKRIYISGDTELADTLCATKNLDVVFAPSWLLIDAKKRNMEIDAEKIILYHHRSTDKITNSSSKIVVPKQYQTFALK